MHRGFQLPLPEHRTARIVAEILTVLSGITLLGCAFSADHAWLDRHFLPRYFVPRHSYVVALWLGRVVAAAVALALIFFVRQRLGRLVSRQPARKLLAHVTPLLLATALALGASELVLRHTFRHSANEVLASEEPQRRLDAKLGWVFSPSRTGRDTVEGRTIEYTFDSSGYRVRRGGDSVDPERPAIVFAGESIMVGHGLNWEETIPAQVEAILGIQSANLAVHGYSTDQAYIRLSTELPHFRRPVAVVLLFSPGLFNRNMDENRPHLGPDLAWQPPKPRWRLALIASILVPYRSTEEIERGVAMTRAVLRSTLDLARAQGAVPVIVVPQYLPEDPTEIVVRHRVLDEAGIPYLRVGLNSYSRLPHDLHPNARADHAIAVAIAGRLRDAGVSPPGKNKAD